jgi:peptidoglycan/LPS O-acetylase OafA/YrhL
MSTSNSERSTSGYRSDVQGLRAVAVLLVILDHYSLLGCTYGYVGVDVFFVISGFVIAGVLFREIEGTGKLSLLTFYARRARRILPASTLTLIATVGATVVLFGQIGSFDVSHDAVAAALFTANFHFASQGVNYFSTGLPPSPLLHFWSLAVEEQFYFVIPSLLLAVTFLTRHKRRVAVIVVGLIVAGSYAWSIIGTHQNYQTAYYSIATRAWELGIGVVIAGVIHRAERIWAWLATVGTWLGAAMIVASAWWLNSKFDYPGSIAAIPVVGAALIILGGAAQPRFGVSRALSLRPAVFMGDLSYSLYLWHFPFIALAARYWGVTPDLTSRLVLLAIAIVVSFLSFKLLENPIRTSAFLKRAPWRSLGVGAVSVILALVISVLPTATLAAHSAVRVNGNPALNKLQTQILAATKLSNFPSASDPPLAPSLSSDSFSIPSLVANCTPSLTQIQIPKCSYGDVTSSKVVVLYGNSQAQMWAPALNKIALHDHFRLVPLAKPACGVFIQPGYVDPTGRISNICERFVTWSIQRMIALHPATIVIAATLGNLLKPGADPNQLDANNRLPASSLVPPTTAETVLGFTKLVTALAPAHAKIVLIGNIPVPLTGGKYPGRTTPNGCLLENLHNIQRCSLAAPSVATSQNRFKLRQAALAANVPLIDVNALLCAHAICPAVVNRILVHYDTLHLSREYAEYVSFGLRGLLAKNLP